MLRISNFSKVVLSLVVLVFLAAVYCAQPTGIPVHEYIGLALYVLFIIYVAFNYKWIINAGKSLFDKTAGARIKFTRIIDILLIIAFIIIGLSGIMISSVIFKLKIWQVWRPLHTIVSAVSIILLPIHIGLRYEKIKNAVKTKIKLPFLTVQIIAAVVFLIILFFGMYGEISKRVEPVHMASVPISHRYETVFSLFQRSVDILGEQPKHGQNQMAGGYYHRIDYTATSGASAYKGQQLSTLNLISILFISVSNYLAFIILCSLIVNIIDSKIVAAPDAGDKPKAAS